MAMIAMTRNGRSTPYIQTISAGLLLHRGWVCLVQGRAELLVVRSPGVKEAG